MIFLKQNWWHSIFYEVFEQKLFFQVRQFKCVNSKLANLSMIRAKNNFALSKPHYLLFTMHNLYKGGWTQEGNKNELVQRLFSFIFLFLNLEREIWKEAIKIINLWVCLQKTDTISFLWYLDHVQPMNFRLDFVSPDQLVSVWYITRIADLFQTGFLYKIDQNL